jgi:ankyrin repeat protein
MTLLKECSLNKNDLTIKDLNGYTLLHHACIAGATICALTLINSGCDTRSTNILNNTPFAESLAYEQQQICMFMIQNNCSVNEQVHYLEEKNITSRIDELKKLILPTDLYREWFSNKASGNGELSSKDRML